jgi:hypothetical protein
MDRQTVEPAVWDVKAAQVYLRDADGQPTDRTYGPVQSHCTTKH